MPTRRELEQKLEDRCVARFEALGGLSLKLAPKGTRGFPDRTNLHPQCRRVWFPEFKRVAVGVISQQQYEWQRRLEAVGCGYYFIETDEQFEEALRKELEQ